MKNLIKEEKTIDPKTVKPGYVYLTKVEDLFASKAGEFFDGKELCIANDKKDIAFFLIDEYKNYNKDNMKKILKLKGKIVDIFDQMFDIDQQIHEMSVLNTIKKDGSLETEQGGKVWIVKELKKI
jgi:hypothetical protein